MTRPRDTRERLLQAATDLIWAHSYHGTGVEAICQASGVQKGCFYHHFASKEALILAALDRLWEQYRPFLDEAFAPAADPATRFARYLSGTLQSQQAARQQSGRVRGCPLFGLGSEISAGEPKLRRRVAQLLDALMKYFAGAIRDGQAAGQFAPGDPDTLAAQVLALSEGALTLARIQNDLAPLRQLEPSVLRLLGRPAPARRAA